MTGNKALKNLKHDLVGRLEEAEFFACYSAALARRVRTRYRQAKWIVAFAACVPFIAQIRTISGSTADWIVAVVPLIAIALPIWSPEKTIETASTLHGRFLQILPPLRALWRELRDFEGPSEAISELTREVAGQLNILEDELAEIRAKVSEIPDIPKLKAKCRGSIPKYSLFNSEGPVAPNEDALYKMGN